jgi:hypothetical protein
MVVFPILTRLSVKGYDLFPGDPPRSGIDQSVPSGVTLITGINGLGKTTLLNIILRLLTGPYDLTGIGVGQLGSTLPAAPVRLNALSRRYFSQRVADGAKNATAVLAVSFGERALIVERQLQTMQLVKATVDDQSILPPNINSDEREKTFQRALYGLMGLSSFVDVLLVLHYAIFFPEERPGALWDPNAQRQLLRALFVPGSAAAAIAEAERQVVSADSYARNVSAVLYQQTRQLEEARERQAIAPGIRALLKSQQALLDAAWQRRSSLDERREELEAEKKAAEVDYEKAKIDRDDAERAVERLKYEALDRMFPKLSDAARLTLLTLLSNGECLVCGAHAEAMRTAIEGQLSEGICPVCHSPPEQQENLVPAHQVETSRLALMREKAELAAQEEAARESELTRLQDEYSELLAALKAINGEVSELQGSVRSLNARNPRAP